MNPEVFAGLEQQPAKNEIADLCGRHLRAHRLDPPAPANYNGALIALIIAYSQEARAILIPGEDFELFGAIVDRARRRFYELACPARENSSVWNALERCRARPEDK